MPRFLDFFTYESVERLEQNHTFNGCTLLRPIGDWTPGQRVDSISIQIEFFLWQGNDLVEDDVVPY